VLPPRHAEYRGSASRPIRAAIAGARRLAHPPSLALSLGIGTILLWLHLDEAVLGERLDELAAVAAEHRFSLYSASGAILRGWVKVKKGDVAEGMSLLRSGSIAYRAIGSGGVDALFYRPLSRGM
jgi:predicted ATPase